MKRAGSGSGLIQVNTFQFQSFLEAAMLYIINGTASICTRLARTRRTLMVNIVLWTYFSKIKI